MSTPKLFAGTPFGANGSVSAQSLGKPVAVYPGAVVTDSDMMIAVDRQQTRLALALNASDVTMTVVDPNIVKAYNLLTIENEIVKTTGAPVGNVVPISRGFDGTAPAVHLANAVISGFVDAYHHNRVVSEIEAIQQTLGPNLANVGAAGLPVYLATVYNFPAQTPGGTLNVGTNSITLTPVPKGVNGTNIEHYLYISGGTGAAEAVLITGGTAVGGAASGTVFVTCANAHSGVWTVQSASGGLMEAIGAMPASGGQAVASANITLFADVTKQGKGGVVVQKLPGCTITWSGGFHYVLDCLPGGLGLEYYRANAEFIFPSFNLPPYTGLYLQQGTSPRPITSTGSVGTKAFSINSQVDMSAANANTENIGLEVNQNLNGGNGAGVGMRSQLTFSGGVMQPLGGGTSILGFTFSNVGGQVFGMNAFVRSNGPVQAALVGIEVDTDCQTVNAAKIGIQIVDIPTSSGTVSAFDASIGLRLAAQPGAVGYNHGIYMADDAGLFPVTVGGNVMTAKGGTVVRGLDFNTMNFSKTFIRGKLPVFASNAAALSGGLSLNDWYTDGAGNVKIVF